MPTNALMRLYSKRVTQSYVIVLVTLQEVLEVVRHVRSKRTTRVRVGRDQETQQQVVLVDCDTRLCL